MSRRALWWFIFLVFISGFRVYAQDAYKNGVPVYSKTPPQDYFREWLICGPFPNPLPPGVTKTPRDSTALGFDWDYLAGLGGETGIQPYEGLSVSRPDGQKVTWRRIRSYFPETVLNLYLKSPGSAVAYAAAIVRVKNDREVMARISSAGSMRVWLNGELVLDHNTPGAGAPNRDFVPVRLTAGDNLFLLKTAERAGRWRFSFRLTSIADAQNDLFKQLPYLIRPTIEKIPEGWSIFAGRKYAVELLPEEKPCTLTIFAPDGHTPEITIQTILGSSVFLSRTDPRLIPGDHLVSCQIFLPNGRVAGETSWFTTGEPESVQTILKDFQAVPPADTATFEGRSHTLIRKGLFSQLTDESKKRNVPAFQRARLKDVVRRFQKWETHLRADTSIYDHILPAPQRVILKKRKHFEWSGSPAFVNLTNGICQADVDRLQRTLGEKWGIFPNMKNAPGNGKNVLLATLRQSDQLRKWGRAVPARFANREAYRLQISADEILLIGASDAGLHNGLVTLNQLAGRWRSLPAAVISDWPAFPVRAAYIHTGGPLTEKERARLLQFIDLKYNQFVLPDFRYFQLDDPGERARVLDYFKFLRSYHVEPVPYVTLPGSEDDDEGIYLRDEPLIFQAGKAQFPVEHLVNLPDTRPFLASGKEGDENRIIYKKGRDYEIVSVNPPAFRLLPGSEIADGDTVYFTGDIFDRRADRFQKPCPSEPAVYRNHEQAVREVVRLLHPRTIHIGDGEVGLVKTDSRCLKRNQAGYELFAGQLNQAYQNVHRADPAIEVQLWADSVNPFHYAAYKHLEQTADLLTRKLILDARCDADDGGGNPDAAGRGTAFFLSRGFRVLAGAGEHLTSLRDWEKVLNRYGRSKPQMLGILYNGQSGKEWGGVSAAMTGWRGSTWLTR